LTFDLIARYGELSKVEVSMPSPRFSIPRSTLDMLILQILSLGPADGYAIAQPLPLAAARFIFKQGDRT
jgi:hypothetical protein